MFQSGRMRVNSSKLLMKITLRKWNTRGEKLLKPMLDT